MAKKTINIGQTTNDRSGDPLRTAFGKVNDNFTELYAAISAGSGVATVVDDTPPSDPEEGALWWDTVDGRLYIRYDSEWVEATTPSVPSTGDIEFTGSTMYNLTGLTISNRDLSHGATASVILPSNGDGDIQLQSLYGGVTIGTGANNAITNTWTFDDTGNITFPNGETLISEPNQFYFHKDSNGSVGEIVLQAGEVGFAANNSTSAGLVLVGPAGTSITAGETTWTFSNTGTLTTPLLLPSSFTAVLNPAHYAGEGTLVLAGDAWEFVVEFQVNPDGTVQTMIGNNTPWFTNPGYVDGYTFTYTEADHGIPGYTFTLEMYDVINPGGAGWTTNLAAGFPPEYPSTIHSAGAIKLTADTSGWVFGTDGVLSVTSGNLKLKNQVETDSAIIWNTGTGAVINNVPLDDYFVIATNTDVGTPHYWKFGTDGNLRLPTGGDIQYSNGQSLLGGIVVIPSATTSVFTFGTDFTQTIVGGDGNGAGYIRVESTSGAPNFDQISISTRLYDMLLTWTTGTQFTIHTIVDETTYDTVVELDYIFGTASGVVSTGRNDLYFTRVSGDELPFSYSATELTLTYTSGEFSFTNSAVAFPDETVQTTAYPGTLAAAKLPYYENTTARDAAITSPANGMVCIVGGSLYFYGNSQWLQLSGTP